MKNIDIKSLIIGVLLTTTVFFGLGATGVGDKWDDKQEWIVVIQKRWFEGNEDPIKPRSVKHPSGWEPFAVDDRWIWHRKRIK